jgi:hypothetical protein
MYNVLTGLYPFYDAGEDSKAVVSTLACRVCVSFCFALLLPGTHATIVATGPDTK